jgi:hypothetical protein
MSTDQRQSTACNRRVATREELTRFYAAIGIPAVVSAVQARKMTARHAVKSTLSIGTCNA